MKKFAICLVAVCLLLSTLVAASAALPKYYTIIRVPWLDVYTLGGANNNGQVVGTAEQPDGVHEAFIWDLRDAFPQGLGTLGGQWSWANAINDLGQVVGGSQISDGSWKAFVWQNGAISELTTPTPSLWYVAIDINNKSQVVGSVIDAGSRDDVGWAQWDPVSPTQWQCVLQATPWPLGWINVYASAINDQADVIIEGMNPENGISKSLLWSDNAYHYFYGDIWGTGNVYDINNFGVAVGKYGNAAIWPYYDYLFPMKLGRIDGSMTSCTSVNNKAQVVGRVYSEHGEPERSFLWLPEGGAQGTTLLLTDLLYNPDPVSDPRKMIIQAPEQINDRGWITAVAQNVDDYWDQEYALLVPAESPKNVDLFPAGSDLKANEWLTFESWYLDYNGAKDLKDCYLFISEEGFNDFKDGIVLRYSVDENKLYLMNDDGTDWLGGITPGSNEILENSRCMLDCKLTDPAQAGVVQMAVSWVIKFKPDMEGKVCAAQQCVSDDANFTDGWEIMRRYSILQQYRVPSNISLDIPADPVQHSTPVMFSSVYYDPNGYADITCCHMYIREGWNTLAEVKYDAVANKLYLLNDQGTDWIAGWAPGTGGAIANSRCQLLCDLTKVQAVGADMLQVDWSIVLDDSFAGKECTAGMTVVDSTNLQAGPQDMRTFHIEAGDPNGPRNMSMFPTSGEWTTETEYELTCVYSDPAGYANIANCYLLINPTADQMNAAYFRYNVDNDQVWVRNDTDDTWLGPRPVGPTATSYVANNFTRLFAPYMSVSKSGNEITIKWVFYLKTPYGIRGDCKAWMRVENKQGLADGWDAMGAFSVKNPSPFQALVNLTGTIRAYNLPKQVNNSLYSKLNEYQTFMTASNIKSAQGSLKAFCNYVRAQSGKKISPPCAQDLIEKATCLSSLIK